MTFPDNVCVHEVAGTGEDAGVFFSCLHHFFSFPIFASLDMAPWELLNVILLRFSLLFGIADTTGSVQWVEESGAKSGRVVCCWLFVNGPGHL